MSSRQVLLVSGSLRAGSTNTALLRTAQRVAPPEITAVLYDGLARLPHFNPDDDRPPLHPAVAELRLAIRASDAILFCTPEYAGALPGSFKNLLEWTIGDDQPPGDARVVGRGGGQLSGLDRGDWPDPGQLARLGTHPQDS